MADPDREVGRDEDMARIDSLEQEGHTCHCAARMVWGDGECTCPPDPIDSAITDIIDQANAVLTKELGEHSAELDNALLDAAETLLKALQQDATIVASNLRRLATERRREAAELEEWAERLER